MAHTVVGDWRITEMDLWDREAIELLGPAVVRFDATGRGRIRFIAVEGLIDWRGAVDADAGRVEFTWEGFDEGDPVSGRGWVEAAADGSLRGRIFFHLGDDSGFRASAGVRWPLP